MYSGSVPRAQPVSPRAELAVSGHVGYHDIGSDERVPLWLHKHRTPCRLHVSELGELWRRHGLQQGYICGWRDMKVYPFGRSELAVLDHLPREQRLPHELIEGIKEQPVMLAKTDR